MRRAPFACTIRGGLPSGREGVDQQRSRNCEIGDHRAKRADEAAHREAVRRGKAKGVQDTRYHQRQADRVRVTAQLIDAGSGAHVWSERWDRTTANLFAVQSEIAEEVARLHGDAGRGWERNEVYQRVLELALERMPAALPEDEPAPVQSAAPKTDVGEGVSASDALPH